MASRSWNRVELIGNLTRDPELRYTPSGAAVCTFGLATNRTYVSEGEKKEEVDFHRLVAWNKLAELCNQLLKKGMKVFISGRLQTRSWEGQDGVQRQTTEIVIEDMIILTPRGNGGYGAVPEDMEHVKAEEPKAKEENEEVVKVEEIKKEEKDEHKEKEEPEGKAPQEEVKDDLPF
ncbi:single-stranded DNA-binding protein [Candidatus Daviesbacteria bacterium]|nr:single-stranded DNA-binding protein [Candidatus Daviesbacteria bacterium]